MLLREYIYNIITRYIVSGIAKGTGVIKTQPTLRFIIGGGLVGQQYN